MATAHCVYIVATLHYSQMGELCYEPGYHYGRLIAFMCQHTYTPATPTPVEGNLATVGFGHNFDVKVACFALSCKSIANMAKTTTSLRHVDANITCHTHTH